MYNNDLLNSTLNVELPPQMIPFEKKNDEWKHTCMDILEQIGKAQYRNNLSLIENYEMVKGRFIYSHYFEQDGYTDFMAQLTREFELPSYLRHYDIISQVVSTLSGEYQKRPDIFRIKNMSEDASNEYERTKTDLIKKYINAKINQEINKKLTEQGIDLTKEDFSSEEERQQYVQMIEESKKVLTPPEIQEYMSTKWSQAAEIWATHQLEHDKQRFNIAEKEKKEFEDMLISDRCFRHFYLTADGYNQETWNPVQTFFQKSPDTDYVEDGDYVGRIFYLSLPAIIDKYGHFMKEEELKALQTNVIKDKNKKWNYSRGSEYVFDEYMVPFKGYKEMSMVANNMPGSNQIPYLDDASLSMLMNGTLFNERKGLYFVTECYWKSQRKIGKVVYIDPETGILTKKYIDENTIIPEGFVEVNSTFQDKEDVNTVTWTWVNQVWKGIKINLKNTSYNKNLYLGIKPLEFQFKGDINPYNAKLPVCGQVFSVRNSKSMSLVDLMKPYQIFYNVAMNQLYQIMEREIGRFVVMDANMFPSLKDWGGENGWEKFMLIAKQLGLGVADTSSNNLPNAAATGGHLPKDFNFDDSARMISRINLAEKFEQMALRQVGFNQYRLGTYAAYTSAQGASQGQAASYAQTESYFTNFSNYLRRCHEMNLNMAQYVQSNNKDIQIMYTKSDMSREYIRLSGTELLTAHLTARVVNSLEFIRQTEALRQLGLNNNTSGASLLDLAEIITANSPEKIKVQLKESADKQLKLQDRDFELKQRQLEQEREIAEKQLELQQQQFEDKLQNNLDVVYAKEGSKIINSENDKLDKDDVEDKSVELNKIKEMTDKLAISKQKLIIDKNYKDQSLALQQAKINRDLEIQNEKLNIAKIMKSK